MVQRRYQECWTCKRQTFDKRTNRCSSCEADAVGGERSTRYIDVTALDSASAGQSLLSDQQEDVAAEPKMLVTNLPLGQLIAVLALGSFIGGGSSLVLTLAVLSFIGRMTQ